MGGHWPSGAGAPALTFSPSEPGRAAGDTRGANGWALPSTGMVSALVQEQAARFCEQLAVLAEPHRLLILRQLRRGPLSAGELAEAVGIAPSLASHHLSTMVNAGLISRRRSGNYVCYEAQAARLQTLFDKVGRMAGAIGAAAEAAAARPSDRC